MPAQPAGETQGPADGAIEGADERARQGYSSYEYTGGHHQRHQQPGFPGVNGAKAGAVLQEKNTLDGTPRYCIQDQQRFQRTQHTGNSYQHPASPRIKPTPATVHEQAANSGPEKRCGKKMCHPRHSRLTLADQRFHPGQQTSRLPPLPL